MPTVDEYVKAKAVLDPLYWGKVYTPDTVSAPYAPHHADLMTLPEPGHAQARSVWRGSAKTTLVRIFAVWLCEHHHVRGILWVRAGWGDCLEDIDALAALCEARGLPYQTNMLRGMVMVNGVPVWFRTPRKKVRGLNHEGIRPDLLLIDDLEDRETAHSADQTKKIGEWLFSDAMQTGEAQHPLRTVMYGTPITPTCLLSQALRSEGSFGVWDAPMVVPIVNEQGEPNWPGNVDPLRRPVDQGGMVPDITWATEYMLQPLPPGTLLFPEMRTVWRHQAPARKWPMVIGVDPAGDGDDATAAVALTLIPQGLYVADVLHWTGSLDDAPPQAAKFIDRQVSDGWGVRGATVEAVGAWKFFAREIVRNLESGVKVRTATPKGTKVDRVLPATTWHKVGALHVNPDLKGSAFDLELHTLTQEGATVTGHDDTLDGFGWAGGPLTNGWKIPPPVTAAA